MYSQLISVYQKKSVVWRPWIFLIKHFFLFVGKDEHFFYYQLMYKYTISLYLKRSEVI
jgi:hypothetical protein